MTKGRRDWVAVMLGLSSLSIAVALSRAGAQEVIRSERLFGEKVSLSDQLLAGKHIGAWAVYDKETVEKGLALSRQGGEGKVETIEAGGRYAAGMVDDKIPKAHYFYFKLAQKPKEGKVDIAVEYFDGGKGQVALAYDADESAFKACPPIELSGGQTWNVVVYRLSDARFSGRCNGGDFRVGNAPEGFAIGAAVVCQPGELTEGDKATR